MFDYGSSTNRKRLRLHLSLELGEVQMVIEPLLSQQACVGAALDDFTIIYHQHLVGVAYGAQTVGDHKAGPSGHQSQQRFL